MGMLEAPTDLRRLVEEATANPSRLDSEEHRTAVEETIAQLDAGKLRMAEKIDGEWQVNAWVQQAILLYFRIT
jgi:2,3,4,5-tetrahydropyridine-2-carboxylate N-succinyltransferase